MKPPLRKVVGLRQKNLRITLLTPYTGNNLGDAAIQDAMIAHLGLRLPGSHFTGITLNCDNFVERHGIEGFPLCASRKAFYGMAYSPEATLGVREPEHGGGIRSRLKHVPFVGWLLKVMYRRVWSLGNEIQHCIRGYHFLCSHDLLIVSGGGQLDEEWGGPWGHPFALFKWAILAWMTRVPVAVASVGACQMQSVTTRFFLSTVLRVAAYRSYRDSRTLEIACTLLARAVQDPIVPDAAFSLQDLPAPAGIPSIAKGRTVVAVSFIVYARPGSWPHEDRTLYERYIAQMAEVISQLLDRDFSLAIVCSAIDDKGVFGEVLKHLSEASRAKLARLSYAPEITTWQELVALLQVCDLLIGSRLHSCILGFAARKPVIAISFDPKVEQVMKDVEQTDYLLQIGTFEARDVMDAVDRLTVQRQSVLDHIDAYRLRIQASLEGQYDALASLAQDRQRRSGAICD